jgi:hypothetical protein
MCDTEIQKIVCRAVITDAYRARLLGSDRESVLRSSGLDAGEEKALMSIQAETIEEFATGVERWMRLSKQSGNRFRKREPISIPGMVAIELPPYCG